MCLNKLLFALFKRFSKIKMYFSGPKLFLKLGLRQLMNNEIKIIFIYTFTNLQYCILFLFTNLYIYFGVWCGCSGLPLFCCLHLRNMLILNFVCVCVYKLPSYIKQYIFLLIRQLFSDIVYLSHHPSYSLEKFLIWGFSGYLCGFLENHEKFSYMMV